MFESDAIIYICTYYDNANPTQNIYCGHCNEFELLLPRCMYKFGDTRHSLIHVVCVLSDIFYFNLASISDVSRPVMINNTNLVPNPSI